MLIYWWFLFSLPQKSVFVAYFFNFTFLHQNCFSLFLWRKISILLYVIFCILIDKFKLFLLLCSGIMFVNCHIFSMPFFLIFSSSAPYLLWMSSSKLMKGVFQAWNYRAFAFWAASEHHIKFTWRYPVELFQYKL